MEVAATAPGGALEDLRVGEGYAALGERFVERRSPTPLPEPYLVAFNPDAAALLDLAEDQARRPEFLRLISGGARFRSVEPFAAVYAGHQFGYYVPRLGDGRAIALGEVETPAGDRYEWQLKGAGRTAFSRFADGRAVLRSTIREYLCSEAMHHLGIPTTRALAVAGSDEAVIRERPETAAVLSRIAPSHVRFGTFEYFHHAGEHETLRSLADATIERFFEEAARERGSVRYASFLREVVARTARLIAQWQAAGFEHGVLNTDNMSILGLTIDYGPFGFMEAYDPGWVCNHSDDGGRYAFERQPAIGLWNCRALALALSSLLPAEEAREPLDAFAPAYAARRLELLRAKFGLHDERPGDAALLDDGLALLAEARADYPGFFRALPALGSTPGPHEAALDGLLRGACGWVRWRERYRARLAAQPLDGAARRAGMNRVNPKYVLRAHLAQNAIAAAQQRDFGELARLHAVLRRPFDEQPENERYALPPPEGTPPPVIGCSS
jgi:uncharacterized protein YdiU (UPF0061 family)